MIQKEINATNFGRNNFWTCIQLKNILKHQNPTPSSLSNVDILNFTWINTHATYLPSTYILTYLVCNNAGMNVSYYYTSSYQSKLEGGGV